MITCDISASSEPRIGEQNIPDIPGDKSISHRVLILAGLAENQSRFENLLCSEDCLNTLAICGN